MNRLTRRHPATKKQPAVRSLCSAVNLKAIGLKIAPNPILEHMVRSYCTAKHVARMETWGILIALRVASERSAHRKIEMDVVVGPAYSFSVFLSYSVFLSIPLLPLPS